MPRSARGAPARARTRESSSGDRDKAARACHSSRLFQADVFEHLLKTVRPHVLGASAVVIGPGDPRSLGFVPQIKRHLLHAIVEIAEGNELLAGLVVELQARTLAADHQRSRKALLERTALDLEDVRAGA